MESEDRKALGAEKGKGSAKDLELITTVGN